MIKAFTLNPSDMKKLYRILKALDEGLISYPEEDWELEYNDHRLKNKKKFKPLIKKIRASIPERDAEEIDKEILLMRYGGYSHGPDEHVYAALEKAFEKRKTANVEYFSPSRKEITHREVNIYYLSRRYIIAFCHMRGEIRKFRTDRFISAKPTDRKYGIPKSFDKNEYL
jgi:predicted DNA-binding transcriptional regulator YafY